MTGYVINFAVYTMAMVGIIFLAVFVYKKSLVGGFNSKKSSNNLKIEEKLALSVKKSLYVVKVNDERFLIASDLERTSFLAKLDENKTIKELEPIERIKTVQKDLKESSVIEKIKEEKSPYIIYEKEQKMPMMKSLLQKLNMAGV